MRHNRTYNNKIKRLHERQLHLIYNYKCSSLEDLLVKDKTVSIYHKNMHALEMEMYVCYFVFLYHFAMITEIKILQTILV